MQTLLIVRHWSQDVGRQREYGTTYQIPKTLNAGEVCDNGLNDDESENSESGDEKPSDDLDINRNIEDSHRRASERNIFVVL